MMEKEESSGVGVVIDSKVYVFSVNFLRGKVFEGHFLELKHRFFFLKCVVFKIKFACLAKSMTEAWQQFNSSKIFVIFPNNFKLLQPKIKSTPSYSNADEYINL